MSLLSVSGNYDLIMINEMIAESHNLKHVSLPVYTYVSASALDILSKTQSDKVLFSSVQ